MKALKFLLVALSFSFLYSCDNMTEEIYLNEDGSGTYEFYTDMIPSMVNMMTMFAGMDSTMAAMSPKDLELAVKTKVWEDFPSEVDSIMPQEQEFLDKYSSDPKKLALAKNMEGFMFGGKARGYLNTGMRGKFDNISELNLLMEMMADNASEDNPQAKGAFDQFGDKKPSFGMKKRCFERKVTTVESEDTGTEEEDMDGMKEMLGDAKYITKIHLPKNVKSVSGDHMIKKTDRIVIFEYPLIDMMEGNIDLDFKIKFK